MLRELCIILLLTVIGIAYSLVGGLSPQPGAEPEPGLGRAGQDSTGGGGGNG